MHHLHVAYDAEQMIVVRPAKLALVLGTAARGICMHSGALPNASTCVLRKRSVSMCSGCVLFSATVDCLTTSLEGLTLLSGESSGFALVCSSLAVRTALGS